MNQHAKQIKLIGEQHAEIERLQSELTSVKWQLEELLKLEPAHQDGGGLFYPVFDGDGNEIGVQTVDPEALLGELFTRIGSIRFDAAPKQPTFTREQIKPLVEAIQGAVDCYEDGNCVGCLNRNKSALAHAEKLGMIKEETK